MTNETGFDVVWWITAVDLPALCGLVWFILRVRQEGETGLDRLRGGLESLGIQAREALAAYKLEVAKTYASLTALREVEQRLTDHLLRIEGKLDGVRTEGAPR